MFLREGNVICLLSARPSSEAMYQRWEYNVEAHSGDILRTEDLMVVHNELLCLDNAAHKKHFRRAVRTVSTS